MKRIKDYIINFSDDYDFCIFSEDPVYMFGDPYFLGNKNDIMKYPDLLDLKVVDHSMFLDVFAFIVEPIPELE